jgi:hypothetical protein
MSIAAWDDPSWAESSDTAWAAGCRWLQAWWRANELGLPPGPLKGGTRLVASSLPHDAPRDANFLTAQIAAAVTARLAEGNHSGIIDEDRLRRNLLSSQPACFNLFGPFVSRPDGLLGWVRSMDPDAAVVTAVRFEWAPPRDQHFGGGSAFDAMILYRATAGGSRFLGVEVKYAEDLAKSSIKVRDPYRTFTNESGLWSDGAADRLDVPRLRQFWLNTLLGQSLVTRGSEFEAGSVVVVAVGTDRSAQTATDAVRAELAAPDTWLRSSPMEEVLDHVDADPDWAEAFRRRYLDFRPVAHLLAGSDPRQVR